MQDSKKGGWRILFIHQVWMLYRDEKMPNGLLDEIGWGPRFRVWGHPEESHCVDPVPDGLLWPLATF